MSNLDVLDMEKIVSSRMERIAQQTKSFII